MYEADRKARRFNEQTKNQARAKRETNLAKTPTKSSPRCHLSARVVSRSRTRTGWTGISLRRCCRRRRRLERRRRFRRGS